MERIMRRPKSREVFEEAKLTLAGGVGSSSRVYPEPLIVECAKGSRVYDIDGNEYVDLLCAYGPIILGHANDAVNEAVIAQIARRSFPVLTCSDFRAPVQRQTIIAYALLVLTLDEIK